MKTLVALDETIVRYCLECIKTDDRDRTAEIRKQARDTLTNALTLLARAKAEAKVG
jgi:hypothetical protein